MDVETAQKEFDRISQKSRRSLQDFTRQGELRKIIKPEDENILERLYHRKYLKA
jgi:hypothetical protein